MLNAFESLFAGLILLLLGYLKLGSLIHYIPYSVKQGSFGAIGIYLYLFSYNVQYDEDISKRVFTNFNISFIFLMHIIGICMYLAQLKWNSPYIIPGTFLFGTIIFHIIRVIVGDSTSEWQNMKWLLSTPYLLYLSYFLINIE